MAFVKLDTGILRSTLWDDRDGRDVFLTALLMAEPFEIIEPTPTYEIRTLNQTDFLVPPGWYGKVEAAGVGIVRMSLAPHEAGMAALERLAAPELESRSQDFDGRRLVRIDGGYIVLNFMKYRDRDYSAATRSQRYRDRKKRLAEEASSHRDATPSRRDITQAEGEAELEVKQKGKRPPRSLPSNNSGEAAIILSRIRALAEEKGGQASGKIIRRDRVAEMGDDILAAYDAVGGSERVIGATGEKVSFLAKDFANTLAEIRKSA